MHARPRAGAGTRASTAGANVARVHQHGGCGWPLARWACMAQALSPPHRGQREGSTAGGNGMWVVFCDRAGALPGARIDLLGRFAMTQALTAVQSQELHRLLLARQGELQAQIAQDRANLAPAEDTAGSVSQDENGRLTNQAREIESALTTLDTGELARIQRALERMAEGSYGLCVECGRPIAFERLKIEPMTLHCVACKSRREQKQGLRG